MNLRTSFQLKLKPVKDPPIQKIKRVVNLTVHNRNLAQSQEGRNKMRKENITKGIDQYQVHHVLHLIQAVRLHLHQIGAHHHHLVIPVPPHILKVWKVEDIKIRNTKIFIIKVRLIKSIPLQITRIAKDMMIDFIRKDQTIIQMHFCSKAKIYKENMIESNDKHRRNKSVFRSL